LSDREDQKRRVHMGALKWQHRLEESTTARQWHSGNPYLRYKHMSPVAHARPATAGGVGSPCAVSRRCSQRLCSFSAAGQWNALTIEEKAPRSKRAAELQELNLQKAPRAPRLRSGYNVFVRDRFHLFGGGLSRVAAAWRVAAPKVRAIYMRRAAELNASVAALPRRREHCTPRLPTAMHLFVKAKIVEAPAGRPPERIRHAVLQWSALSRDEKAVWTRKAADLRQTTVP